MTNRSSTNPRQALSMISWLLADGMPPAVDAALRSFACAEGDERVIAYGRAVVELSRAFVLTLDEVDALLGVAIQARGATDTNEHDSHRRRSTMAPTRTTMSVDSLKRRLRQLGDGAATAQARTRARTMFQDHVAVDVCDIEARASSEHDWWLLGTVRSVDADAARAEVRQFDETQRRRVVDEITEPWPRGSLLVTSAK